MNVEYGFQSIRPKMYAQIVINDDVSLPWIEWSTWLGLITSASTLTWLIVRFDLPIEPIVSGFIAG